MKNTKIRESVDRLFNEPFEPQWMKKRPDNTNAPNITINGRYKQEALKTRLRIASRCNGSKYRNTPVI